MLRNSRSVPIVRDRMMRMSVPRKPAETMDPMMAPGTATAALEASSERETAQSNEPEGARVERNGEVSTEISDEVSEGGGMDEGGDAQMVQTGERNDRIKAKPGVHPVRFSK